MTKRRRSISAGLRCCGKQNNYKCITRPHRFGGSVAVNMIAAYFGKGRDTRPVFVQPAVRSRNWYQVHMNQHNVIHIAFNSLPAVALNMFLEYDMAPKKKFSEYFGFLDNGVAIFEF